MTRHTAFTNLLLSLPLATGLLCAAPAASAQNTASVTIPFGFTANNHHLAAGSYKVQVSDRFLTLYNVKTSRTEILMVRPESGRAIESQSRLTFRSNGGHYYLAQLWMAGSSTHSELVARPSRNREVAQAIQPASQTFEIALK